MCTHTHTHTNEPSVTLNISKHGEELIRLHPVSPSAAVTQRKASRGSNPPVRRGGLAELVRPLTLQLDVGGGKGDVFPFLPLGPSRDVVDPAPHATPWFGTQSLSVLSLFPAERAPMQTHGQLVGFLTKFFGQKYLIIFKKTAQHIIPYLPLLNNFPWTIREE